LLEQSVFTEHVLPLAHAEQLWPPQSTSVSLPFLTLSVQLPFEHLPAVHTPLTQSVPMEQNLPERHGEQLPPQSMSVSLPFLTTSAQVGSAHKPTVHTPLTQSAPLPHPFPAAQSGQRPPQSTSVSRPFCTASVQIDAWQSLGLPLQTLLWQSVFALHVLDVPHLVLQLPPQSVSASVPLWTLSLQVGSAHAPLVHTPLVQSAAAPHDRPAAHAAHKPPQSTSVSKPFFTPSAQPGA
jgi:hypothetical protein